MPAYNLIMAQINLPRSGGGLVSYKDEYKSKLIFSPYVLVALIVLVVVAEYIVHTFFWKMFNINPKLMKQAMKKMGLKQEEIDATKVEIFLNDKKIIINNPSVVKVNMMGKDSFQISGDISEESIERFSSDDVDTVVKQSGCSKEEALKALEEKGDIAEAIISLKG